MKLRLSSLSLPSRPSHIATRLTSIFHVSKPAPDQKRFFPVRVTTALCNFGTIEPIDTVARICATRP